MATPARPVALITVFSQGVLSRILSAIAATASVPGNVDLNRLPGGESALRRLRF